jgi:hypothetical protein
VHRSKQAEAQRAILFLGEYLRAMLGRPAAGGPGSIAVGPGSIAGRDSAPRSTALRGGHGPPNGHSMEWMEQIVTGWLARVFATALGTIGPESILATLAIAMFTTSLLAPKGIRRTAGGRVSSVATLAAAIACHFWLPTLEPTYELGAFGRAPISEAPKVPAQLLRGELSASHGTFFRDPQGRAVILRGVNLAGSSKIPAGTSGTHEWHGFTEQVSVGNISFVGRPFPLEEADVHFARLRAWGLTFIRFLVTWEAVEHAGPGMYDEEYLAYLHDVVAAAGRHGISVFIDPHQDVWSRFTGGDGAPAWTLDMVAPAPPAARCAALTRESGRAAGGLQHLGAARQRRGIHTSGPRAETTGRRGPGRD